MRYVVVVDGQKVEVALNGSSARVGDFAAEAQVCEVDGTPVLLTTVDGRIHRVLARRGSAAGKYTIHLGGYRFECEALDERTRAIRELAGSGSRPAGPASVAAPMPGLVVRVLVKPGDRVEPGQGVVVIEAMKMENELRASVAGVVGRVAVSAGNAVEKGAVLIEFERSQ
jgi:biotin carboxyl carrier protein